MSEHRMIRFGVAALILVLILVMGAGAIQQSAWSQGYMMGLIAGGGEGDALSQYVLFNSGRGLGVGNVIGGFFKLGLVFFGLMLLAKFVFGMAHMRRWRMAGGPDGEQMHGWHHGPPWSRCHHERTADTAASDATESPASDAATDVKSETAE